MMAAPPRDEDLRLSERLEGLAVKQFASEPCIKAFDLAALPRRGRLYLEGPGGRLL